MCDIFKYADGLNAHTPEECPTLFLLRGAISNALIELVAVVTLSISYV